MTKGTNQLQKIPSTLQKMAATVSALLAIFGAVAGAGNWLVHEITATTNERIDALELMIETNNQENRLSIVRLELMTLISNDPTNIVEIEKLARIYFGELDGNSYMTSVVSKWCKEYDSDCSKIILK